MQRYKRLSRRYQAHFRRHRKKTHKRLLHIKGHPFIVPVTTFLLLFFVSSIGLVLFGSQTIGASDSHLVHISIDGQKRTVPTRANTVKDLLQRLQLSYVPEDVIEPKLDTPILEDNLTVSVYRARPVTVVDGSHRQTILSAHRQPRKVAVQAGVELYPEDGIKVEKAPDLSQDIVLGEQVVIDRATPANINLYGNAIAIRTRAKTVGELLDQKSIKPLEGDTVQPSRDTPITNDVQIFIVRLGKQILSEEISIPAPIKTVDDPNLAAGASEVKEAGSDGKKIVTYELELQNGREVSRKLIQEVVAVNPTNRVISKGTKVLLTGSKEDWLVAAGVDPSQYAGADYIISRESGWCPTKWQGEYGGCPAYHGAPTSNIGYGLCQATPGSKMSTAGADWAVNPVTQLKWCTNYANTRYGSWNRAYEFWVVNHWW